MEAATLKMLKRKLDRKGLIVMLIKVIKRLDDMVVIDKWNVARPQCLPESSPAPVLHTRF